MKTDAQLQKDVLDELTWDPAVLATGIGVEVRNGIVTLAGDVETYSEKWNAERAAQRVNGVRALAVAMTVNLPPSAKQSDTEIAESATHILGWTNSLPKDAVKVMVEDGWLTLIGEVEWQYQREDAFNNVRFVAGVIGVSNGITIKPSPSAIVIKSDIEAALKRRAVNDGKAISVAVKGSQVILSGDVHSWTERDLATRSAWGSAGVSKVVDHMNLVY